MTLWPAIKATPDGILMESNNYVCLKNICGIPKQETNDLEGTIVFVFGIKVAIGFFNSCVLFNKLNKIYEMAIWDLNKQNMMLFEL